jgi:NADPH:quinone reductase-like Zn-dependent oxidoreductase
VIDYTTTPFEEVANDMDVVLDTVGGETLERSWSVIKKGGVLISLVAQPSSEKASLYGIRALKPTALASNKDLEDIVQLVVEGKVKSIISKAFSLQEAGQAQELSQHGHGRGRIVLHIVD